MPRLMKYADYRDEQWQHRYDVHVEPINRLVDKLRSSDCGEVPYVAPIYGGVSAKILSVLRDPGPMTREGVGSGFLSMQNDDPSAEAYCKYLSEVEVEAIDIVPWNIYPWYINAAPNASQLREGIEPLYKLIELLPKLKVIMLHGGSAHDGWRRFFKIYPRLVLERGIQVIETYHTSRQALWTPDADERARRIKNIQKAFKEASLIVKPLKRD